MLPVNCNLTFRFCFISLLVLFVLYFLNDLDVDSQYFSNIYAAEIANNNNNYDGGKERINFDYIFDSSEYFEEDNVPQNNNNNNNSQSISQQQSEEEEKQQSYNEIKKEKTSSNSNNKNKGQNYEFTSIER